MFYLQSNNRFYQRIGNCFFARLFYFNTRTEVQLTNRLVVDEKKPMRFQ